MKIEITKNERLGRYNGFRLYLREFSNGDRRLFAFRDTGTPNQIMAVDAELPGFINEINRVLFDEQMFQKDVVRLRDELSRIPGAVVETDVEFFDR